MTQTDPTPDARLVEREALARILRRGGWCFTSIGNSASALAFNFAVEQFCQEVEALSAIPSLAGELTHSERVEYETQVLEAEMEANTLRAQLAAKDAELRCWLALHENGGPSNETRDKLAVATRAALKGPCDD